MRMIKTWLRRGGILTATAVCALLVPFGSAQAALVTYSFTGSINGIDPLLAPVSGSFQFDNGTGGTGGAYNGAVTAVTVSIGGVIGHTASFTSGANAVTISQNLPVGGGIVDRWSLSSSMTGPALDGTGYTPFNFDLRLNKQGGGLFANTDLQDPPSLGAVSSARWRLFFEDADGNPAVMLGSLTSLTAVPLPAAVLLFGAGLISLVGLGAGGLRNLRGSQA